MTTTAATPSKLHNGNWGAKVQSDTVAVGDTVTITTRSGKSWDAVIERVVWSGEGVSICATRSLDRRPATAKPSPVRGGTWTGCGCGSVEEFEKPTDCRSCAHDRY